MLRESFFKLGLQSSDHETFDLDQNFGAGSQIFWFRSELEHRSWNIWFRSELRCGFTNLLIQIGTLEHRSWNIWFRSELRCGFTNLLIQIGTSVRVHKSFDSDRYFGAGSQIFWFRSELWSTDHETFDLDQYFGGGFTNLLIQIGTLEHRSWIIWFRSVLRCGFTNLWFRSELEHRSWIIWFRSVLQCGFTNLLIQIGTWAQIMNHFFRSVLRCGFTNLLIQIGTLEHRSWIIWFRSVLRCGFTNLLIQIGTGSQMFWFRSELWSTDC